MHVWCPRKAPALNLPCCSLLVPPTGAPLQAILACRCSARELCRQGHIIATVPAGSDDDSLFAALLERTLSQSPPPKIHSIE